MKQPHDLVILLHGILRTRKSMTGLAKHIEGQGFLTLNFTYASTKKPLHELADDVRAMMAAEETFHKAAKVHFVTHSMGGVVLRHFLERHREDLGGRLGRVVMLGPPNRGSELADIFHGLPPYRWVFGPAGQQMRVGDNAAQIPQGPVDYDLGVIAGSVGWPYPDGALFLKGPHDGRVTVENTRLDGMKDHVTIPVMHGMMMGHKGVRQNVTNFLKTGQFSGVKSLEP
jgi:triacylglycerol lipase